MSKRLIVVLALLFVAGTTFAAYAEVQNVKVSGDIVASGVSRHHFNPVPTTGAKSEITQSFLMSQVRLRVDADLTDNVMTTVRLINERIWNGQNDTNNNASAMNNEISLDLAYVTLKEFLYSPLSLTVGRQEISFGNGLIMGNAKVPGNATPIHTDLTERKAFDAIRAVLNYDPLIVDLVFAKVKQSNTVDKNTTSLAGINATYALNKNTNISGYYWFKRDNNVTSAAITTSRPDKVNTVGALITSAPIENLNASAELAYQFGKNTASTNQKKHDAWALQAIADYTFAKVKTTPKVGASYTYLSGRSTGDTRNVGWDPMFYDQKLNNITYALLPFTNMHVVNLKASCKPVDDVTLAANFGYYTVAQKGTTGTTTLTSPHSFDGGTNFLNGVNMTGKRELGSALDVTVTYDYTEDVQFGLTGGYFKFGRAFVENEKNAQQLIGSMKVVF